MSIAGVAYPSENYLGLTTYLRDASRITTTALRPNRLKPFMNFSDEREPSERTNAS